MNHRLTVFVLINIYSSLVFSIDVNIKSSLHEINVKFDQEPSECEVFTYVKMNINKFFPDLPKLDRGLTVIYSENNSFYIRLSRDRNNYHCNENGMYVCKNCCSDDKLDLMGFHYKFLPPSEYNLLCNRCNTYFINEDDYSSHLIKCFPTFFRRFL